jgi:hypothetical protein
MSIDYLGFSAPHTVFERNVIIFYVFLCIRGILWDKIQYTS